MTDTWLDELKAKEMFERIRESNEHGKRLAIYYAKIQARETLRANGYLLHVDPARTSPMACRS